VKCGPEMVVVPVVLFECGAACNVVGQAYREGLVTGLFGDVNVALRVMFWDRHTERGL
jgi:hypothetical protein